MTYFEPQYDPEGFELPYPAEACEAGRQYPETQCGGVVHTRYSRSGMTTSLRCEAHEMAHQDVLDGINRRYPDSPFAPQWFDETYAGERWDEDY